jgi:hypothetical protein
VNRSHNSNILALFAAAACVTFPLTAAAQQPAQPTTPSAYLDQAKQDLSTVPKSVQHDASKPMDELRKHFDELSKQYQQERNTIGPPVATEDPNKDVRTWRDSFSDVERDLAVIIGGGSTLAATSVIGAQIGVTPAPPQQNIAALAPSPMPGAVGTSGTTTTGTSATTGTTSTTGTMATTGTTSTGSSSAPVVTATAPSIATPATGASNTTPPTVASTTPATTPSQSGASSTSTTAAGQPLPPGVVVPGQSGGQSTPANAPGAPIETTAAGGLAAASVSAIGLTDLKPQLRAQLETFRLQLEMFYSATMTMPTGGAAR